ncbi:hypothetical protein DAEQUDRAFT_78101 [Daedalea quercina L-15889]|uniref:Uncharacterized protein n=1 Tax=Daedalea quercina L-15889 TaxID=1314783 RepID=A0A165SFT7_9APHY|nr:hypothetical protein DAEQUDRAFT_78101 [Daedalea quercina L-15889]
MNRWSDAPSIPATGSFPEMELSAGCLLLVQTPIGGLPADARYGLYEYNMPFALTSSLVAMAHRSLYRAKGTRCSICCCAIGTRWGINSCCMPLGTSSSFSLFRWTCMLLPVGYHTVLMHQTDDFDEIDREQNGYMATCYASVCCSIAEHAPAIQTRIL